MISPPDSIQNVGNDSLMRDSLDALARIPQAEIGPPLPVAPFKETISEILPNFFYTQYSKDMQVHDRLIDSESWIVLLLLASLFLIGIIKTYYQKETQIILIYAQNQRNTNHFEWVLWVWVWVCGCVWLVT